MIENRKHIISRFRWNTFFDTKDKAPELQDRLSAWSRIKMPLEITDVFDELCPSAQVWKIQSLEIDLGTIDYNELEHELTTRLRRQLTEKLTDLILHTNSNSSIEVLDRNTSLMGMIGHFLLHGFVPWNSKTNDWSLNQVLAEQLKTNRSQIIAMLREIGVTHEDVRKRIVWQVSEDNITEIIKGLEPGNYDQVIDFSNEMTRIQARKNIVQAGLADFRKNLWLGILNYLLAERGTVFNKIAFIKSNLRQMAAHYNISYAEFIGMIGRALSKVEQHVIVKADIIITLKTLVKEDGTDGVKIHTGKEQTADYWQVLKTSLNDASLDKKEIEINDLIAGLSDLDEGRFRELLLSLRNDENGLFSATNRLNDSSLETMFSALIPGNRAISAQSINFLDMLCRESGLDIDRKFLWRAGLKFLLDKKQTFFTNAEFLDYIITEVSKKRQLSKTDITWRLINVKVPSFAKSTEAFEIFNDLTSLFIPGSPADNLDSALHLNELLAKLVEQLITRKDKSLFVSMKSMVVKYMLLNPKAAYDVLLAYTDKEGLGKLLSYILDDHLTDLLNRHTGKTSESINSFQADDQSQSKGPRNRIYQIKSGSKLSTEEIFSLIEQSITSEAGIIAAGGKEFHLSELMLTGMEVQASEVRRIISNTSFSGQRIEMLNTVVPFSQFSLLIANDATGTLYDSVKTIRTLHDLMILIAPDSVDNKLLNLYWKQLWQVIKTNNLPASDLKNLLQQSFQKLAQATAVNSEYVISEIKKRDIRLTPRLRNALVEYLPAFSIMPDSPQSKEADELENYRQNGQLHDLACHVIINKQIPEWVKRDGRTISELLNEIADHHPEHLFIILKHEIIPERQLQWLDQVINFKTLIGSIGRLNRPQQLLLNNIATLYEAFGRIRIGGISAKEMQYLLFKKLIKAWTMNNWNVISATNIWNELIWSLSSRYGISGAQFIQDIERPCLYLSPSLQIAFDQLKEERTKPVKDWDRSAALKQVRQLLQKKESSSIIKDAIPVRNAGLVLINGYLPVLLERLELIKNKAFVDVVSQSQTVHYLQYVVTGLSRTEEFLLPLNKIICGLPLSFPVEDGIEISDTHKNIIEGLIKAMINHWSQIGESSINGFRGNWLVRDGLLTEQDDRWELTVEKRAYDLLLQRSPFSFSIIKYPWMDKPLHVNWPY